MSAAQPTTAGPGAFLPEPMEGESAVPRLLVRILSAADDLRAARPDAVPVAFWDFDGTLIEGDCSEGLLRADGQGFPGLVEVAMMRGFSAQYAGGGALEHFQEDVRRTWQTEGFAVANGYIVQAFAGAREEALRTLARQHFAEVMGAWMYREALDIWRGLERAGVRNHVISASADFFVKGAAETLGAAEEHLHGIRLVAGPDGLLTREILAPLTHGEGKATRMREVLTKLAAQEPRSTFWPVAAFGNHLITDGPLLQAVAEFALPAGAPVGVLINGGASSSSQFHDIDFAPRDMRTQAENP